MSAPNNATILITGGSGFLSLHCIAQALTAGYNVRTTVRNPSKQQSVLDGLRNAQPPVPINSANLRFVTCDLLKDDNWAAAVRDVQLVLHVASPFPNSQPKDENDLIRPAVDGTLRVLKAAHAAGTVKRVVLTSSGVAISSGVAYTSDKIFTEADWSDPQGREVYITPYGKSKTLAERAAWDFIRDSGTQMELSVVNPVGIFGPPLLLPCESTTVNLIRDMLLGSHPALPDIAIHVVDVRDVAGLHLLVAIRPEASGQRYQCVAGLAEEVTLLDISHMLRRGLGSAASKTPMRVMPNLFARAFAYIRPQLASVVHDLGKRKNLSNEKARTLGWRPRSNEEAILACGRALLEAGLAK